MRQIKSDRMLMARAKKGDRKAFEEIYTAYRPVALKAARQVLRQEETIDDVASHVMEKVFEKIAQYDPRFSVSTWVYRMAFNASIDLKRRDKVVRFHSLEARQNDDEGPRLDPADPNELSSPLATAMSNETRALVRAAVNELPEPYRTALIQRAFEEMDYAEIAKRGGCTISTARWRYSEALQMFASIIKTRHGRMGA